MRRTKKSRAGSNPQGGYILLAVMLLITLMLVGLAVELPRIAQQLKRDKEDELVHRGKEYASAIKKFYHKNGTYPVSLEQLEDTNHLRFLRKRYKDPMNPDGEWKLIHVGEAQINLPAPNPNASPTPGASPSPGSSPSPTPPAGNPGTGGLGTGTGPAPSGNMGALTTQNIGNGQTFGGGPIIGVASNSKKTSIKEFNGETEYDRWLFVYEPRLEQTQPGGGVIIASPRAAGSPPGSQPGPAGAPTQQLGPPPSGASPTATPQVPQ
jgi:type II secretory pathway pseudopilin PulG